MSSNEHHKPPKPLRAPALPRPRHKQSHTIKMSGLLHTAFGKHWRVQPSGYPGLQMQKFWVSPATRPERDCAPPRSLNFAVLFPVAFAHASALAVRRATMQGMR